MNEYNSMDAIMELLRGGDNNFAEGGLAETESESSTVIPRRAGEYGRRYFTDPTYTATGLDVAGDALATGADAVNIPGYTFNRQLRADPNTPYVPSVTAGTGTLTSNAGTDTLTSGAGTDIFGAGTDIFVDTGELNSFLGGLDFDHTIAAGRTSSAALLNSGYSAAEVAEALGGTATAETVQSYMDYFNTGEGSEGWVDAGTDTVVARGGADTVTTTTAGDIITDGTGGINTFVQGLDLSNTTEAGRISAAALVDSGYSAAAIAAALGEGNTAEAVQTYIDYYTTGAGSEGYVASTTTTGADTIVDGTETDLLDVAERSLVSGTGGYTDNGDGTLTNPEGTYILNMGDDGVWAATAVGEADTVVDVTETDTVNPVLSTFVSQFSGTLTAEDYRTIGNQRTHSLASIAAAFSTATNPVTVAQLEANIARANLTTADVALNTFAAPFYNRALTENDYLAFADSDFTVAQIAGQLELNPTDLNNNVEYYKNIRAASKLAQGGIVGGYAQGGYLGGQGYYLGGTTDGMADQVPATIDNNEPARLSHGEFVIPADAVAHFGNGNSEAGADFLTDMLSNIREDRTGNPNQGRQIDPNQYLA